MGDIEIGGLPTPIKKAKVYHKDIIETKNPDGTSKIWGFAAVLVPEDGEKRDGHVILNLTDDKISKYSKPVATACEGKAHWTHVGAASVEVLNVVPQEEELNILIRIQGGPIEYRAHVLVYY